MFSRLLNGSSDTTENDKLTEVYPVRIQKCLKDFADTLSPELKHILNQEIRDLIGFWVHVSKYDPKMYQKTD
jgi:hypothetical protein